MIDAKMSSKEVCMIGAEDVIDEKRFCIHIPKQRCQLPILVAVELDAMKSSKGSFEWMEGILTAL